MTPMFPFFNEKIRLCRLEAPRASYQSPELPPYLYLTLDGFKIRLDRGGQTLSLRRALEQPEGNTPASMGKCMNLAIIPGRRMKVYSRKLYRQYGGGSSSSRLNHATQKSSSVFSPKRWRTNRHRQLAYQRGILSQPHRHRARRIYGYSFRKSIKPNYYDADKRPRANAVARLNTARLVKKKMMSSGVAK
ncbi:unnamed protein product [Nippostrongylus brasiliensis]|uniref:60S ribosomal protein L28 n=1 Tax=Nippostrongylus brasiliensis TaxID=27835 RepID=A0A0N4YHW5_NIPBR|nr:unnamed protein product [Nippostrongylus brasiliensis]